MEDLVGSRIVNPEGQEIGRVVDVQTTLGPPMRVIGLVVGRFGWLHRLRVARPLRPRLPEARTIDLVPWELVEWWDGYCVGIREPDAPALPAPEGRD